MTEHHTTRRAILVGTATAAIAGAAIAQPLAISTAGATAVPSDRTIFELVALLTEAGRRDDEVGDRIEIAETAFYAWCDRNPRPNMRDPVVGTNADYERWMSGQSTYDPNGDLKASIAEHQAAQTAYSQRKNAAEQQSGLTAVRAEQEVTAGAVGELIDGLAETPARSLAGVKAKAAVADKYGSTELAASVVRDLAAIAA